VNCDRSDRGLTGLFDTICWPDRSARLVGQIGRPDWSARSIGLSHLLRSPSILAPPVTLFYRQPWDMNEPLHPTRSVLARPSRAPGPGPDPTGSCSFDLLFPIDRPGLEPALDGPELDNPDFVPDFVVVDWDATEAHCAPEVQAPEVQAPEVQAPEVQAPSAKPTLATDFMDLLIRKPAPSMRPLGASAIGQSISPIINPIGAPAIQRPPVAPVETRSEADRIPSRDLLLQLPKVKTTRISSHRHSTNPALSLGILEDIARVVTQWRDEIDGLHQQIQALYGDGPILEAWLESAQGNQNPSLDPSPDLTDSPSPSLNPADHKTYWICGLDNDGQPWRETCSPKDLPQVIAAIARYQTLRQLMRQKQHHEQRLNQLAKTLTVLRGRLRA
jgi:hypothetical protein